MPANPHQCRLYASRFFALAKNARSWRHDKSSPRWPRRGTDSPPRRNPIKRCYRHFLRGSLAGLMMICLTP